MSRLNGSSKFSYNIAMHLATKQSLLKVAYGMEQLQSADLVIKKTHSTLEFNQDGEDLANKQEQVLEKIKLLLDKSQMLYKKQVNAKRHEVE